MVTLHDVDARPLAGLTKKNAPREIAAGVTLLAIAVPLNIGYSQIAGLDPSAGLYALVIPTIIYVLTVGSRQLVASPDAAASALVASSLGGLAVAGSGTYADMALAQAMICGVLMILMSVFRLGFIADFLSKPILIGFVAGLAFDILVSQVIKMLGITGSHGHEFVSKVATLVTGWTDIKPWSVVLAAGCVAVLVAGRRLNPLIPWALITLIISSIVVSVTGVSADQVAILGPVEAGLPALTWPALSWQQWLAIVPSALALAVVGASEGLLVSRSYANRRGYPNRPNKDLMAFGLSNVAAGFQGSFTIGASTSRTAAVDQIGARTQLPSLILAAGTLLLLVFGTGVLAHIPSPAIGAIVAVAVVRLLAIGEFRELARTDRAEFSIGVVCFAVTLIVGAIPGILVAFVLALINLARRAAQPAIDVVQADGAAEASLLDRTSKATVSAPGVLVVRVAAPLIFANIVTVVESIQQRITAEPEHPIRHLVLDMEAVTDVDVTAAEQLLTFKAWLAEHGVELSFSRFRPQMQHRMRQHDLLEDERMFATNRAAVSELSADAASRGQDN
ncbi:SulP family inorganic anion transporter [Zhihengliuella flava]|uniref:High affinity sulfate transporter 1 n=1 Tax=Zhihengliuella flava TaxID=1285193 RepID=A0A931GFM0_9MICC|nr:SulP family inorganic anion transporter [Zhihengliuella flava]MBG6085518.1 high affinity sulfate transporter 1 [Zhihengliuella flava]